MLKDLSLSKNYFKTVFVLILFSFISISSAQVQTLKSNQKTSQTSIEIQSARELIGLGLLKEAERMISLQLKKTPRDAQWRYLNAVVLAEFAIINQNNDSQNLPSSKSQIDKAIESFERLTEEFPELSEPYNNLSVLYLMRGQPNRARDALEKAIINNPNYELAYENLGDLYTLLAKVTYKKGLAKLPKSLRLDKKFNHLSKMPFISKPNIIIKFKSK